MESAIEIRSGTSIAIVPSMESIIEIRRLAEEEKLGKACGKFPSSGSSSRCGAQAEWEVCETTETVIVRADNTKPTSYDLRTYYCQKHSPAR